jgi:hypothetical protein
MGWSMVDDVLRPSYTHDIYIGNSTLVRCDDDVQWLRGCGVQLVAHLFNATLSVDAPNCDKCDLHLNG